MRARLNNRILRLLLAVGVKPQQVGYYRDVGLAFPTLLGVVLALVPVFNLLGRQPVSGHDLRKAAAGLGLALFCSMISPNWGDVLGAAFAFLAFRGLIALLLVTRDTTMVLSTLAFLTLAFVLHRVGGDSYG